VIELLVAFGAGVVALGFAAWATTRGACPRCGQRALRWTYARKDRGPDLRYSKNPRYCAACGWTEGEDAGDDGLRQLTAGSRDGLPIAVPLDVDRPETDEEVRRVEAALQRMADRGAASARRTIAASTRKSLDSARALDELERGAAEVELGYSLAAVEEGAELQAESEILRDRLERLGVPPDEISRTLKKLAQSSL
jgi:hypothetical protein